MSRPNRDPLAAIRRTQEEVNALTIELAGVVTRAEMEVKQKFPNIGDEVLEIYLSDVLRPYLKASGDPKSAGSDSSAEVPLFAERALLLILNRKDHDAVLGDLEEKYRKYAARHGVRYAKFWYWSQVVRSIGPALANAAAWAWKRLM